MPRLRCPRCSAIFSKPESNPVCPACGYAPRTPSKPMAASGQPAAWPSEPADRQAAAEPGGESVDGTPASPPKLTRKERKALRERETAHAPEAIKAADDQRPSRRFFGKKKLGKRVPALLSTAFFTLLVASALPFAGTVDLKGQDATIDVATGHFVLQRAANTTDVTLRPYLTSENRGVDANQARLGEMVVVAGILLTLAALVFAWAKRPGIVVCLGVAAFIVVLVGSILLQGALKSYPGDLFPLGPSAMVGGIVQGAVALVFALVYALKRPTPAS